MRLGQLARKLALKPNEIVEFLAVHTIQIEEGSNTKLEDNHVALVLKHFAPVSAESASLTASDHVTDTQNIPVEIPSHELPVTPEVILEKESNEIIEPVSNSSSEETETPGEEPVETNGIIKAPKIALSGLKVLGKIEIPEPRKKEIKSESNTIAADENPVTGKEEVVRPDPSVKASYKERARIERRPRKNPIASAREQEAAELESKRRAELEQEKIKRTQNYLKKVKMAPPIKAAKINDEPVEQMSESELAEKPTLWKKFIKWLTS